ncbi:DUF2799 domain-containing protein [Neopusillimonas aromaticivorans]|uniref:DUF2799 domain-containing protein n=1 Tax=Neopusillimonas aromaticivorans TaxID=2979868 RepID=UPI002595DC99|nr:DUF2799 domain-containing protein [Neopusillimonas aromaticivorans]WJJ94752.1 DUF2799 domain-containing protein [Neopusillimonas aromaticivorans]
MIRACVPGTRFYVPRKLLLATGVALALSGCASMTPEECRTANWYEQGQRDGSRGQPRSYIEEHREACMKVGVTPDAGLWEKGAPKAYANTARRTTGLKSGVAGVLPQCLPAGT